MGRGKIRTIREALERLLQNTESGELRATIARLERISAELARVESKLAGRVGVH